MFKRGVFHFVLPYIYLKLLDLISYVPVRQI